MKLSSTERDEPTLSIPYTEQADPTRMKLLHDSEDPRLAASNMDNELANRARPYKDRLDPQRTIDLIETADPKCTKSNTEKFDPMREAP
jgi:hypothetical protein